MDERETLRASLRELLRRPPLASSIPDVMAVREFKKKHADATKLADKIGATTAQLSSAVETIRAYVVARAPA